MAKRFINYLCFKCSRHDQEVLGESDTYYKIRCPSCHRIREVRKDIILF